MPDGDGMWMFDMMFSTISSGVFPFSFSGLSQAWLRILLPSSVEDILRISRFLLSLSSPNSSSLSSSVEEAAPSALEFVSAWELLQLRLRFKLECSEVDSSLPVVGSYWADATA